LLFLPFFSLGAERSLELAEQIDFREVDDFVTAPVENHFHHEKADGLPQKFYSC